MVALVAEAWQSLITLYVAVDASWGPRNTKRQTNRLEGGAATSAGVKWLAGSGGTRPGADY